MDDLYIMQKTATLNELAELIDQTGDIEYVSNAVAYAINEGHQKSAAIHPQDAESNLMLAAQQEVWHDFTTELTKTASLNAMYGFGLHPYEMMVDAIEKVAKKRDEDREERGIIGWAKQNPVKAGLAGAGIAGGVALGGKSAYDTYQQLKGNPEFGALGQAASDARKGMTDARWDQAKMVGRGMYDNAGANLRNIPGAEFAQSIPGKIREGVVGAGRYVHGGLQGLKNDMTSSASYDPYGQHQGFAPVSHEELAYANDIYKRAGFVSDGDVSGMLSGAGYFDQQGGWGY